MDVDSSEAAEECAVLERIFLSVVMTQNDEQFEGCLRKFLPHILKKSGSEHAEVRAKVVEVLSHVSKRVRATQSVALPVEALLDIYSQPGSSVFLLNFSIIYIKMGFVRLSPEDKKKLMPRLLEIAANRPLQHQESLCILFLTNLKDFGRIKDSREKSDIFNVKNSQIKKLLLDISMDVLLFPYGCTGESNLTDISVESYKRLTRDNLIELNADYFEQLKINVIYFLSNLNSTEIFPHLVVASSDARYSVAELAETHLKMLPDIDYGDLSIVTPLYSLFLKVGTGGSAIVSLNPRTRLKLLQNLSKFRAIVWPAALKVLFESLYGSYSNPKIKNHALIFAANIIRNLPLSKLEPVWPILIDSGVMKLLREDTDRKNKIQAFQLLPTLVLKCPNLAKKDLKCVEFIFNAIENENDPDLRSAARDAAFSMARAYKGIESSEEKFLYTLLTSKLFPVSGPGKGEQIEGMKVARTAAVRFISEACSRTPTKVYLLLKSAVLGDEDSCTEARKALYNVSKSKKNKKDEFLSGLVGFVELLELVLFEENVSPHDHNVMNEIVKYLRICLSYEVNGSINPISHPSEESPLVKKKLEQYYESNPDLLIKYINVLIKNTRSEASFQCLTALHEIVGCLNCLSEPVLACSDFFIDICLTHTKDYIRNLSAEIVSIVVSQDLSRVTIQKCLEAIETNEKDIEKLHGSIALIGFIVSRHGGAKKKHVDTILKFLKHANLQSIAITSLGNVSLLYPLPLTNDEIDVIVGQLLDLLFDAKTTPKVKDQICSTLSNMCVVGDFPSKDKIIEKFIESSRLIKDVDLSFSTAETFTSAVLGKASPTVLSPWNRDEESIEAFKLKLRTSGSNEIEFASGKFDSVVERLLKNLNEDRHPLTRQSICFWLLGLIKRCSFLPVVEKWLSEIQNGFIDLLSDNNDLVQEGAGKGLALVYDATEDKEKKSALLKMVIEQVTLGRKSVVKVSDETRLFQPDELGETPTGGKLSTYKELCQLASDLNQPDLIYKFMHLANHNSIWNSKKGAAYTITSLLSKAGDELEGQLPKVLIKLYRYQYDPMPNIQRSMAEVWSSLASPDTVEKYYAEIFEDILVNLTNVTWRVRISCCAAVQDFMRGPSGNKIIQNCPEKIGELWSQLIRVMDDIHERTRNMAVSAAKSLSKICIRESKEGGKAGKTLSGIVLKVLLNNGIKNSVSEIRTLSISTVSDMIKEGLSKEDAPVVIISLLRSCADIDLANLYVAGQAIDTLDKIRVPMLKSNNVVQALVSCLPQIDGTTAEKLHLELVDLLKPSAGFGSRIVTSHFVVLMSHHLSKDEFQPMVGKFLGSLLSGLSDRSPGIRRQFASTIGQILRYAKDSSVERLLEKMRTLYFEKDDEVRKAICYTLQSISLHSQDTVKDKEDLVLPLVFFAKHLELDADKSNKSDVDDWSDLWNDLAYTNNVLILNESKVVELLSEASRSQSWKMKAQMARSARTLGLRENLSNERRLELTRILLESLPGRTWDGKEHILHALSAMAKQPKSIIESGLDNDLVESLIKECKKDRESYKIHAFQVLGEVVEALEKDIFDSIYPLLKENLKKEKSEDDEKEVTKFKLIEMTYETVGKCWPRNPQKQEIYINEVLNHMKTKVQNSTSQVQVAILACVSSVVTKSRDFLRAEKNGLNSIVDLLIDIMDFCFSLAKNTKLKKEALNLLHTLQITFRGINEYTYSRLLAFFNKYSPTLAKEGAPEIKSRFADIKEMFSSETLMS